MGPILRRPVCLLYVISSKRVLIKFLLPVLNAQFQQACICWPIGVISVMIRFH